MGMLIKNNWQIDEHTQEVPALEWSSEYEVGILHVIIYLRARELHARPSS